MKTLKLFFAVVLAAVFSFSAQAQSNKKSDTKAKTETINVAGNCGMCKTRIEKAAKTEGVSAASWDSKTKLLTVSYDPSKTGTDAVGNRPHQFFRIHPLETIEVALADVYAVFKESPQVGQVCKPITSAMTPSRSNMTARYFPMSIEQASDIVSLVGTH
jgi:hypothetical protein